MPKYKIDIVAYEPKVRNLTALADVPDIQLALVEARKEIRKATGVYSIVFKPVPLHGYDVVENNHLVAHFSISVL